MKLAAPSTVAVLLRRGAIRHTRESLSRSVPECAAHLGIKRARWYQYEAATSLTYATVERIAASLGVPVKNLLQRA